MAYGYWEKWNKPMSKADPTISGREMRYRKAQAQRGLKLVRVWVPEQQVDVIKATAEKMRADHADTDGEVSPEDGMGEEP